MPCCLQSGWRAAAAPAARRVDRQLKSMMQVGILSSSSASLLLRIYLLGRPRGPGCTSAALVVFCGAEYESASQHGAAQGV